MRRRMVMSDVPDAVALDDLIGPDSAVARYSYAWQFTGYQIAAMVGFRVLVVSHSTPGGIDAVGLVLCCPIIGVSFRL